MNTKENIDDAAMKELEDKVEKKVTTVVTTAITILIQAAIVFGITIIVLKFVWAWMVPDLFPGAVVEGLISAELSWKTALKFAAIMVVLTGANGSFKGTNSTKKR